MPPHDYAWLAALALLAARDTPADDEPRRPPVVQITGLSGVVLLVARDAANDLVLVLIGLCQSLRKLAHARTIPAQISPARQTARIPVPARPRAPLAPWLTRAKTITAPQCPHI